jgi:hypothetical protein
MVSALQHLICSAETRRHRMPHASMRVAALALILLTTASAHAHQRDGVGSTKMGEAAAHR